MSKLSKILLTIKAVRHYRKRIRGLRTGLAELNDKYSALLIEKNSLTLRYERLLSVERKKNELLHVEWASRFLQLQNLSAIGLSLPSAQEAKADIEDAQQVTKLGNAALIEETSYFSDLKEAFWEDGRKMGKSDAEINAYWSKKKDSVIQEVIEAYSDEYSDTSN